jgi:hypothetical protein
MSHKRSSARALQQVTHLLGGERGPVAIGDLGGKETIALDQDHRDGNGFDLDAPVPLSDLQLLA